MQGENTVRHTETDMPITGSHKKVRPSLRPACPASCCGNPGPPRGLLLEGHLCSSQADTLWACTIIMQVQVMQQASTAPGRCDVPWGMCPYKRCIASSVSCKA